MKKRVSITVALWLGFYHVPGLAVEGRVPLIGPTTITVPGSYIVTQDFSVATGDGITISANDVTLDLNGHTITLTQGTGVRVTSGFSAIRIRNGRLLGGYAGITASQGGGNLVISIERVQIENPQQGGILIEHPRVVEILESIVRLLPTSGIAISAYSGAGPFTGRLIDNTVESVYGSAIQLLGCYDIDIRGNSVRRTGTGQFDSGVGIDLACTGVRIVGNSVSHASGGAGLGIRLNTPSNNNLILENTLSGFSRGIEIQTNGNRVAGNVVGAATSHGIEVNGQRNVIENNQIEGNGGCGISFVTNSNNAYRSNTLRGNSGGAVCGVANTDGGGNIL